MQRSALCRSRRALSNADLFAKFGFDTAENETCKVCPIERWMKQVVVDGQELGCAALAAKGLCEPQFDAGGLGAIRDLCPVASADR